MHITNLGGHSGCKVLLCEDDNNRTFVRKISGKKEYNSRLRIQAEKQGNFQSDSIRAPRIYGSGITADGLYYFDMEYIQGVTLAEYMKKIEIGKIRSLVKAIVHDITPKKPVCSNVDEAIFFNKIASLKEKLSGLKNEVVDTALDMLQSHSWKRFTRSGCHGDLTLENIIVKSDQLYLIDFLDSFYDCWIMDLSTLMQDVQTMWAYRYQDEVEINTLLRLIVFRDILMDEVKTIASVDYIEVYYALLLKLIRIYPYKKDDRTYDFLNEKTASIIQIILAEGAG